MTNILALTCLALFLFGCGAREENFGIVVVPDDKLISTGEPMIRTLYLVRKLDAEEVDIHLDQEDVFVEYQDDGAISMSMLMSEEKDALLSGTITLREGRREFPFKSESVVLKPSGVVTSHVLIRGRKNHLDFGIPGVPVTDITLMVTNAVATKEDHRFYVVPGEKDTVKVMLSYITGSGTRETTIPTIFEVVDLK